MITEEERQETLKVLMKSGTLAKKYGQMLTDEAEDAQQSVLAGAIMFSTFCAAAEMTVEEMNGLLLEVHKITIKVGDEADK